MHAVVLNCTLKASPDRSSTEALAWLVMTALEAEALGARPLPPPSD